MEKLDEIERTALGVVRTAGRYGAHLTHIGFEVAGFAEWLELQIPRVRRALCAVADVAQAELGRVVEGFEDRS